MPADPRLRAQIQLILDTHQDAAVFPDDWEEPGNVGYIYRENVILSGGQDVTRVIESIDVSFPREEETGQASRYEVSRASGGIQRISLRGLPPVPAVLDALDAELGTGVATIDAFLYPCPYPCPATEPVEVPPGTLAPFPPPDSCEPCRHPGQPGGRAGCDGDGVSVSVVDTGLLPDAAAGHPWLAGVTGTAEDPYFPGTDQIRPYAGHGTFAAGCLRCTAPKAQVFVAKGFDSGTGQFESDLTPVLEGALDRHPDIFVFTFVSATRKDLSLKTFDDLYERRIRHVKGLVVIAPAGNDGKSRWMWPAACPWVVSVGALSASWRDRAHFSNHGGWVDVYAPGEDLVNAFAHGSYICDEPPAGEHRHFRGMARWSGTSFSAPVFAGLVAARMSATGENGQRAAASLLRLARGQAVRGIGAVLYPGQACLRGEEACLPAASLPARPCGCR
ncbi:MAG TPA: S8/S53 family peptidase [Trebonia sp.]|nr:S8/S53 family peptidase [Trebonia sp.]